MDFLKAEIERKRKLMEEAKVLKTSSGPTANKYFKRGELLKKQVGLGPSLLSYTYIIDQESKKDG